MLPTFPKYESKQSGIFFPVTTNQTGTILACRQFEDLSLQSPPLQEISSALNRELKSKPDIRGIFLGIESDPCTPTRLSNTLSCMELFFSKGLKVWLQTSQLFDLNFLELLIRHPEQVHLILPFGETNASPTENANPDIPSTASRLKQLSTLKHLGIQVDVCLSHIIPGKEIRQNLRPILRELAYRGFTKVFCSFDFHPLGAITNTPSAHVDDNTHKTEVLPYFGPCLLFSRKIRSQGYSRIMEMGQELGIQVQIDKLSNPDFANQAQSQAPLPTTNLKEKYLALTGHQIR